jgi:hypothetical protein
MPTTQARQRELEARALAAAAEAVEEVRAKRAAFREFIEGFRRSRRGNLWRRWDRRRDRYGAAATAEATTVTLTVFRRGPWYAWCVADEDGPGFGPWRYADERAALAGLWAALQEDAACP